MRKFILTALVFLMIIPLSMGDTIIRSGNLRGWSAKYNYQLPEYTGPVATRGRLNDFYSTSSSLVYMQSRTTHIATDNISVAQVIWNGLYINGPNENAVSATADITGSIEYPAGTFTQLTWSSGTTGHILSGQNLISDQVTLNTPIPEGAQFWVRSWVHWTSANRPYSTDSMDWIYPTESGEVAEWSSSALTDKTMSGSLVESSFHAAIYRPVAILGPTRKYTFFLMGDSRTRASGSGGNNDISGGMPGTIGEIERAVAAKGFGYINGSMIGDSYNSATQAYTRRAELASYCQVMIDNYGINDLGTGATITPTQFNNYIGILRALNGISGKPYYRSTLVPRSTSTDKFSSLANQSTVASNTSRVDFNNAIRLGTLSNVDGYIEVADQNESSRDSGIWRVDNCRTLTSDVTTVNGNTTITSASGGFIASDEGASAYVGSSLLYVNRYVDAQHVTVQVAPTSSASGQTAYMDCATADGLHATKRGDLNISTSTAFDVLDRYR